MKRLLLALLFTAPLYPSAASAPVETDPDVLEVTTPAAAGTFSTQFTTAAGERALTKRAQERTARDSSEEILSKYANSSNIEPYLQAKLQELLALYEIIKDAIDPDSAHMLFNDFIRKAANLYILNDDYVQEPEKFEKLVTAKLGTFPPFILRKIHKMMSAEHQMRARTLAVIDQCVQPKEVEAEVTATVPALPKVLLPIISGYSYEPTRYSINDLRPYIYVSNTYGRNRGQVQLAQSYLNSIEGLITIPEINLAEAIYLGGPITSVSASEFADCASLRSLVIVGDDSKLTSFPLTAVLTHCKKLTSVRLEGRFSVNVRKKLFEVWAAIKKSGGLTINQLGNAS